MERIGDPMKLGRVVSSRRLHESVAPEDEISERNLPKFRGWDGPIGGDWRGWVDYSYPKCPDIRVGFRDADGYLQLSVGVKGSGGDLYNEITDYEPCVQNVRTIMGSNLVNRLVKPLADELDTFSDKSSPAAAVTAVFWYDSYVDRLRSVFDRVREGYLTPGLRKKLIPTSKG